MVGPDEYDRKICYDDLATGGSIMVFGPERNVLEVASRVHGVLHRGELRLLHAVPRGQRAAQGAAREDHRRARASRRPAVPRGAGRDGQAMSRCGLGQTSANPVLTTLKNFRRQYEALVKEDPDLQPSFDLRRRWDAERSPAASRCIFDEKRERHERQDYIHDRRRRDPGPARARRSSRRPGGGKYIPRLCAMKDLVPHGSCRVCTVMVNGRPQAACTQPSRRA
jgi:hypothetical protein